MRFEELDVWKRSARLSAELYKIDPETGIHWKREAEGIARMLHAMIRASRRRGAPQRRT